MNERTQNGRLTLAVCLLLGAITLAVFWPVLHHPFTNLDDPEYVTQNPHVLAGLSWENLHWAFTTGYAANWHPLTWLSHMLDVQWFGMNAGLHHLSSLIFHVASSVLLFLALRRLTGALWRSACVAALFALHPLHVESVAWVAERKDVLSAFFFTLTLLAYSRYVEGRRQKAEGRTKGSNQKSVISNQKSVISGQKTVISNQKSQAGNQPFETKSRSTEHGTRSSLHAPHPETLHAPTLHASTLWYVATLLAFTLGLMSKPMLVTVPFLLLLLDYWPLRRFDFETQKSKIKNLAIEKVPFLALAIASSAITFLVQDQSRAVGPVAVLPLESRLANAVLAYFKYLAKTFWPADLAVFYPHPYLKFPYLDPVITLPVVVAAVVLIAVTVSVLLRLKTQPYLATGWFWFIGMLVPVIGLVQVGSQAMADRYMYLPLVGLSICLVWGIADFLQGRRFAPQLLGATAALSILACIGATCKQVSYWRDDVALFEHAIAVTKNNAQAHCNLSSALGRLGKYDEAIGHLRTAVSLIPNYADAHYNLGYAYMSQGKLPEAASEYEAALTNRPYDFPARLNLGAVLVAMGKPEAAVEQYRQAARLQPGSVSCEFDLGRTLFATGQFAEAAEHFTEAARLSPTNVDSHLGLGNALFELGRTHEAAGAFADALRLDPALPEKLLQGGKNLLAQGQLELALMQFSTLLRFQPDNATAHESFAMICAQQGKVDQALPHFERCLQLRPDAQSYYNLGLARVMQGRLREALTNYVEAVRLSPDWPTALNDLAWLLATHPDADARNGPEAVRLAQHACDLTGGKEARFWGTLDAAYAEAGRFDEAITTAEKTRQLATTSGETNLIQAADTRLALYRNRQAFHQPN